MRDHKRELLENLVRLRRAAGALPGNGELAAVRDSLERELGPSVSQRLAADAVGVSHTALGRLVEAGDIATVPSPNGRDGVPVGEVLRLRDAVDELRSNGEDRRVLEPIVRARRDRAQQMDPARLAASDRPDHGHRGAELRSLAYHCALAPQLTDEMISDARQRLFSWQQRGQIDRAYAERWEAVLSRPLHEIRELISDDSDSAADLRQTSPLAGLLSEPERRRIVAEVR